VDVYGSWLPVEAGGAVNVLAEGLDMSLPATNRATGRELRTRARNVLKARGF
jgi:hypothetical protein